ncbi:MAG: FG-GAP repeat protein, partial [Anaerolineales bacterium]|nr:FG-GAP repeat protein [Anaerolineales bacterium]
MKTLRTVLNFVCMIALLLGLTSYTPAAASNVENVFHHTQSAPRLAKALVGRPAGVAPSGLSDSEWASIQEQIRAAEYHISRQVQEGQDVYRASNQAQGFDAAFSAQGLSATAQPDIQSPWNFGLTLQAYGGQPVLDASLSAERAQVTATHSSAVKEWYENTPQGVKHGLTLYAPPENGSLTLDFAISGSLQARQAPDGGLHLYDASGEAMLTYDNLAVYDASGKLLSANMSLIPGGLRIAINAAGAVYPITVDPLLHTPLITLRASDPEAYDWFGGAVAIDGDTLVVGAPGYPITYTGAAYVFERNQDGTDAWGEVAILYASDAQQGDEFGASVSISGDIIVVGAPDADDGAYTGNGAAYVFYRNQGGADLWGEVKILYGSSPNDFDYFGISVDIDGDTIVVGAENKWGGYGWAHVFQRNFGGEDYWGEIAYISGFGSGPGDYFGHSVAIAGDTIVVGAPGEVGTGRAYVFSRNWDGEDTWGRVADLSASDMQSGDNFGWSVDISADTLVVGAYSEDGGTDDPLPGAGAAYVFQRNQGGADLWGEVAILRASDAQSDDNLGASVAIAGDTIVVGADQEDGGFGDLLPNSGAAYVYSRNQGGADAWGEINILHSSEAETEDYFGISAAISGDTIVVGSENEDGGPGSPLPEAGAAYLFTATGVWLEIAALHIGDPQFGEHFGIATAVDDNTLVVGAPEINMAYVFYRNQGGADTWAEAAALWASDGKIGDWFGHSVAIAGDTIVVGAYGDDGPGEIQPYAGAAYIFQRNQGGADTWGEVTILHASDAQAGDQFGLSLSIDDETIVVGAPTEDGGGGDPYDNAGAAYVFSRNQGGADAWGEVAILHASDAEPSDGFGISVSISADTIVAGAHNEDGGLGSPALSAGAAYVFSRNQGGVDAWGEVKIMRASDAQAGDIFGVSVAISGDTIVVGASQEDGGAGDPLLLAGAAYVFSRNQGGAENWGEMTILRAADAQAGDGFGRVSISGDAIVVGADYEDGGPGDPLTDSGAAYVFGRNQGGADHWGQVRTLHASDAQANDTFGSVAISGDTLIVGAYSEDGGAGDFYPDTGAAYIFTLQANWEPTPLPQPLESEASDLFGAVALSGDTLVVGAHGADAGAGAAYVFYRDQISAYQWYQVAVLAASDAQPGDNFGWAVAVYSDTVVIGAPYHDQITDTLVLTDAGAAYVFQRDQGGDDAWGQTAILYASDAQDGDHFGYSVSIDGGTIAI